MYPDASEDIDQRLPSPLVDEISITVLVDSDHVHDKVTRRLIPGTIIFVGRTPGFYLSKRQGLIETSIWCRVLRNENMYGRTYFAVVNAKMFRSRQS
jgi:hypothetical protein